jgi:hypothetical protein
MSNEEQGTIRGSRLAWPFRSRKAILVPLLLLGVLAVAIWQRRAAPDVPEPFDVPEFVSFSIPENQNAFTIYRQAGQLLVFEPMKEVPSGGRGASANYDEVIAKGFQAANEDCRKWLASNRVALDLWRRGSERSQAVDVMPADLGWLQLPDCVRPRELSRLSLLEAARITDEQSPSEAWGWYRAGLRCSRHVEMHAGAIGRFLGTATQSASVPAILRWSANPKLTAADLRRALADVVAIGQMTPPVSENLEVEYLFSLRCVDEGNAGMSGLWQRVMGYKNRLRRGLKLVYANWLSQADRPRFKRTPSAGGKWFLFELDPALSRSPQILSPAEIEDRCGLARGSAEAATIGLLMPSTQALFAAVDREQTRQAALVLGLALELYHREHGHFPAQLDELVQAKYLAAIPADPFGKGEPFHYRREADPAKGALLWSVWIDGVDQEGKVEVDSQREAGPGDKVFRILTPR